MDLWLEFRTVMLRLGLLPVLISRIFARYQRNLGVNKAFSFILGIVHIFHVRELMEYQFSVRVIVVIESRIINVDLER